MHIVLLPLQEVKPEVYPYQTRCKTLSRTGVFLRTFL